MYDIKFKLKKKLLRATVLFCKEHIMKQIFKVRFYIFELIRNSKNYAFFTIDTTNWLIATQCPSGCVYGLNDFYPFT